jgi:hypothetical protein
MAQSHWDHHCLNPEPALCACAHSAKVAVRVVGPGAEITLTAASHDAAAWPAMSPQAAPKAFAD